MTESVLRTSKDKITIHGVMIGVFREPNTGILSPVLHEAARPLRMVFGNQDSMLVSKKALPWAYAKQGRIGVFEKVYRRLIEKNQYERAATLKRVQK